MKIIEFYDYVKFEVGNKWYQFYFIDIVDYINKYYKPNDIITDIDGLCNYITDLSENGDINGLIKLFKYIDNDIDCFDYVIISENGLSCWRFNDLEDLCNIYNIKDIVVDLITNQQLETYCYEL